MKQEILGQYKKIVKQRFLLVVSVTLVLLTVALISIISGSAEIGFRELYHLITGSGNAFTEQIIYQIRLPRVVGGILAGTALGASGAVIQSLLRNPLASPFTLGISGASAFGAAFGIIILGAGSSYNGSDDLAMIDNPYIVTTSAFLWSLLSVVFIVMLSKFRGATPEIIILAGIIISSLFGAGISAMQYFADNVQLASIIFWTFGDLGRSSWKHVFILTAFLIPILIFFYYNRWNYKSLQSGDEYAQSLGMNVYRVRLSGMVAASLATAIVVSFFGIIAFVGLVVPHIMRRMIGGDDQFLIPASSVFGGMFLLLSDTFARLIISPVVLPVGILTSFIGAPLLLFLLFRNMKNSYWS